VRIISGRAGGTRLKVPGGGDVRPTSDRVKEAVFASLGDIQELAVVDLFSGSGALGLEALSRGATTVCFVERSDRHIRCIRENLERVRKCLGEEVLSQADVRIIRGDVSALPSLLAGEEGTFDLMLADPPYHPSGKEMGPVELVSDPAIAAWSGKSLLVLEHSSDTLVPWAPASAWRLLKNRRFGSRQVSFARCDQQASLAT
jgi:16S rRNA (guanine966-N2)-methyltransferase